MQRRIQQLTLRPRLSRQRSRLLMVAAALAVVLTSVGGSAGPAHGQPDGADGGLPACPADLDSVATSDDVVRIVSLSGLLDPVLAEFLLDELDHAERTDALAIVLLLDSRGSVLDDAEYQEVAERLASSPVTVAIWVGQSGATAQGGAAELLGVADVVGVSPGSSIGSTGPARLPESFGPAFGEATERLRTTTIGADEAVALGISVGPLSDVATLGPFLTNIEGYEVFQCQVGTVADGDGDETEGPTGDLTGLRTVPVTQNELVGLPLSSQLFHTVASPEVAYLFFAMGLGLLLFELYTAGIGIAGVLGAGFLTLGAYGLAVLPARPLGIALLILAVLALAVDVQTNVPRFYTGVGLGLFVVGTFLLYDGISMSWVTIVAGIVGAVLYAYAGMPSMVRTRFSTPTIGRKWMIGEMGQAITDVSPDGTVRVRDVAWQARTNRATPVSAGDRIRVVGLDQLVLEVEPEEGGARDYRDRRASTS